MDRAEAHGYVRMPSIEETVAVHLCPYFSSLGADLSLQSKPCKFTAHLADEAYASAGEAVSALHSMAVLQVFQAKLLRSLDGGVKAVGRRQWVGPEKKCHGLRRSPHRYGTPSLAANLCQAFVLRTIQKGVESSLKALPPSALFCVMSPLFLQATFPMFGGRIVPLTNELIQRGLLPLRGPGLELEEKVLLLEAQVEKQLQSASTDSQSQSEEMTHLKQGLAESERQLSVAMMEAQKQREELSQAQEALKRQLQSHLEQMKAAEDTSWECLEKERKMTKDLGQAATKLQQLLRNSQDQLAKEKVRTLQDKLQDKKLYEDFREI
ncbi:unnamed protein product [Leuciscus chuanchicus]